MSNVINMFSQREDKKYREETLEDFEKVMKANQENKERLRKERETANKNLIRNLQRK